MTWPGPWTWQDAKDARAARKLFGPSKSAERAYARQLRSVAQQVAGTLAKGPAGSEHALQKYSESLEPWARLAAANMVRSVAHKNEQSWREAAKRWGIDLRGLLDADVTAAVDKRIEENVRLIMSIPSQAADQVAKMSREVLLSGARVDTLTEKIAALGDVAHNRARVIALTEVSKAGTALTRARAESAGSDGYIWRTARDGQTRSSHAAMEGRFVKWSDPPTLDNMTGHAGEFPNCRCYPEPVVPDMTGETSPSPIPTRTDEKVSGSHKLRSHWEKSESSLVVPHAPGNPLPGLDRAAFDMDKLTAYSMDPAGDKARVWKSALGMDRRHADEVKRQIMAQLPKVPAVRRDQDEWGERFRVVVPVTGPNGRAVDVTTGWIYDRQKGSVTTAPRLTTCFVGR